MSKTYELTSEILLFDLDGTLINSIEAVSKSWLDLCEKYHVDSSFIHLSHGVRTVETLKKHFPMIADPQQAALDFDAAIATNYGNLVYAIPGGEFLKDINPDKWCIVTSGNPTLARRWFGTVLPLKAPKVFITAADVTHGKPDPEGYLKGAELLTNDKTNTIKGIVFEDATAGVKAGKNAGHKVIGITTSFTPQELYEAGADYVIKDLNDIKVISNGEGENPIVLQVQSTLI